MECNHIYKSHNKTLLLYHIVFPIKYRRTVIREEVGESLKQICIEISERYKIHFVEIGYEGDHVHFLIQSVPRLSRFFVFSYFKIVILKVEFSSSCLGG